MARRFGLFPENTRLEEVLLKVVALNDLYRTGILATCPVAENYHLAAFCLRDIKVPVARRQRVLPPGVEPAGRKRRTTSAGG